MQKTSPKLRNDVAKFVLSLGATVNMDGTAIGFPCAVVFLAYAQGMVLSGSQQVRKNTILPFVKILKNEFFSSKAMIALIATVSSMGAAPIPSSGLVLLVLIMESVNVPVTSLFGVIIGMFFSYTQLLFSNSFSCSNCNGSNRLDLRPP